MVQFSLFIIGRRPTGGLMRNQYNSFGAQIIVVAFTTVSHKIKKIGCFSNCAAL